MRMEKVFRNPEARRVTRKFIIVLIIGVISIAITSFAIGKYINKLMIDQNTVTIANILEGKTDSSIIKNFYELRDVEKIDEAKALLKSYGYDETLSLSSNEIHKKILNIILMTFIPMAVIFLMVLYIVFIRELKGIYFQINNIVENTCAMSKGEYKKIQEYMGEGEMESLISSLNYMGERVNNSIRLLREDKENLKDFLSDISHQLKTPLASLVMFNDLVRENVNMPNDDRATFLEKSDEQLRRMEWLIMNLLKLGRIEANAIKFEEEIQPLRDTINLAMSSLREEAKRKAQELIITGDLDAEVLHDKEWLSEAISNIVKNAIEHTEEQGKIKIKVNKGPLITKIYIKDNGPGISREMQKKVFKRFYKGENSKNPKSIGIGLSLAKSIIEGQGGEIKIVSEEGLGTTFIISFIRPIN
ncbi:sensor histidine kinase [Clostridium vincentii]|uniref:histidine kinase n=1 Tax=Clostridium vincentii TaxID=52704 RepID=A0A2T0BL25_9CLOT|nr:HAMP domain-containing sensor histidine kinase [Clostridium vincentii]PRR84577.1 Sensor protein SrrB [Clostridium vincentii]